MNDSYFSMSLLKKVIPEMTRKKSGCEFNSTSLGPSYLPSS